MYSGSLDDRRPGGVLGVEQSPAGRPAGPTRPPVRHFSSGGPDLIRCPPELAGSDRWRESGPRPGPPRRASQGRRRPTGTCQPFGRPLGLRLLRLRGRFPDTGSRPAPRADPDIATEVQERSLGVGIVGEPAHVSSKQRRAVRAKLNFAGRARCRRSPADRRPTEHRATQPTSPAAGPPTVISGSACGLAHF